MYVLHKTSSHGSFSSRTEEIFSLCGQTAQAKSVVWST